MALFEWSDKFSINVPERDEQHKKLVNLINKLHDSKQNQKEEGLGLILNELVSYTKTHLKCEEKLLQEHQYPDYESHKANHDNLVEQVLEMQKKYNSGDTSMTTDLAVLLNDWLAEHILVVDKEYSPYIK